MTNLTLAIDDQLLKDARSVAFERETTLTELIREYLGVLAKGLAVKRRMRAKRMIDMFERNAVHVGKRTWTREDLYERG